MEEDQHSLNLQMAAESALLVQSFLERRRHTATKKQAANCPDGDTGDVNWVVSKDFTVEVGKKQIGEYIQTWELQPCWLYILDFLHSTEEEHHTFHHYRARFSTPTPRKPIQGTAGVYFVVVVSKVKPHTLPAEVHFVVESNRLVHTPGGTRFREKWLADVIESKILIQRAVDLWSN